ncbi:hypothetical protein P7K49_036815 [Saguinus oedipus]|uniref:Uncharacterized protein n=1 Tax=Saguinus oedipus TaxID=9490 RepID=A0ABQ9TLR7_SAGOE|nr:hypothetical protein P7K49_036815 [Saguinus oedipus]
MEEEENEPPQGLATVNLDEKQTGGKPADGDHFTLGSWAEVAVWGPGPDSEVQAAHQEGKWLNRVTETAGKLA